MTRAARLRVEPLEDRLAPAAGQFDTSFSGDGAVASNLPNLTVSQISLLPDGRFFAYGQQNIGTGSAVPVLERFNPDGTLDTTFGNGGVVTPPSPGTNFFGLLAAFPDGGALLGGSLTGPTTSGFTFTRLSPTGTVDPAFGSGGTVTFDFSALGVGSAAATTATIQSDGRILVAGVGELPASTLDGVTIANRGMAVARLTSDGQLDTSFGTGGRSLVTFPVGRFNQATASSVAVQPDGKVVLAGGAAVDGSVSVRGPGIPPTWRTRTDPVAVRLTADGQLDPTFGDGGRVLVTRSGATFGLDFDAARVLADGRVVLAATDFGVPSLAVRLTADGQPDPTYGTGGRFAANTSLGTSVGIAADGQVVFAFGSVVRLKANGQPDTAFGDPFPVPDTGFGAADLPFGGSSTAVAVQPDGNILVGRAEESNILYRLIGTNPPTGFVSPVGGAFTAGGAANGTVQVLNPTSGTYAAAGATTAYAGFAGSVRSTTADVNGDGTPDLITAAGPGALPAVTVFDGKTGALLADFLAFEGTFTGGLFVAAANLEGDGRAEIVVTPDQGGGPRVVIFSVAPGGVVSPRASFFGFDDANFRGGARIAAGDVNNDGTPDLVVAAGFLGGPRVAVIDGTTAFRPAQTKLVGDFFAFSGSDAATLRNGVYVASGDVNGDGFADLVFGGGPGGAPRVFTLSGELLTNGGPVTAQSYPISNFFIDNNGTDRGGVTVATTAGAVAVGSGQGNAGRVRVYRSADVAASPAEPTTFQDVSVFGGAAIPGGVFVG
jgi:uncharacterized delta-60 repeat protein